MDGCFKFWELGCRIDWEAWSAIGAVFAAITALAIAGRDRRDRSKRERLEARILAELLRSELSVMKGRFVAILEALDEKRGDVDRATYLEASKGMQAAFGAVLSQMTLAETHLAYPRLHVLPNEVSGAQARALGLSKALVLMGNTFEHSANGHGTLTTERINLCLRDLDVCRSAYDEAARHLDEFLRA